MRLDKYLAEASIGTRKIVRMYVKDGKVTVNDQVVLEPATDINEEKDMIKYLGDKVVHDGKIYYMFHKPAGCVTARKDENKKTVLDYFDKVNCNSLFPVGRLDMDTEGLLFLTNDGEFSHQLMHPDKHVDKTYFFWAFGSLSEGDKIKLETGINIGNDESITKPAKIEVDKQGMYEELKEQMDIGECIKKKKNLYHQSVVSGYLTISEGQKHQVKRMLKAVGCYVVYLKRISIGSVSLDPSLKLGEYRELIIEEVQRLLKE
ncbi:pseudouridine synthase [Anaeromicropila herbilytica]|uniref:Pseudouridine synthase n=1 Tax=Anaeromicropila herbilytica TaxID=2785025 RepID=A0A7R7IF02_9FIRM|nr:pseudouridine synthase [Anaeromicropila herbilytica]BCN32571.1 pseudouridine synthase [Anaeromicropila herbilytica]